MVEISKLVTYGDLQKYLLDLSRYVFGAPSIIHIPYRDTFGYKIRPRVDIRSYSVDWMIDVFKAGSVDNKEWKDDIYSGMILFSLLDVGRVLVDIDRTVYEKETIYPREEKIDETARWASEYTLDMEIRKSEAIKYGWNKLILIPFDELMETLSNSILNNNKINHSELQVSLN